MSNSKAIVTLAVERNTSAAINYTGREYYATWGLPPDFEEVVQCGMIDL